MIAGTLSRQLRAAGLAFLFLGGCASKECREARASEEEAGQAYLKAASTHNALSVPYFECDTPKNVATAVDAGLLTKSTRHDKDYCAAADRAYAEASLAFDVAHRAWIEAGTTVTARCK